MYIAEVLYQYRDSDKLAIKGKSNVSYRELNRKCIQISQILQDNISDNIAILIPNSEEYLVAYFGVLYSKNKCILLNVDLTETEILNILQSGHVSKLISISKYKSKLELISQLFPVVFVDQIKFNENMQFSEIDFSDMNEEDETLIFPTSGTTGISKLVKISTRNLMINLNALKKIYRVNDTNCELIVLPLYSSFSNIVMLNCINSQATLVLYHGMFSARGFLNTILENNVTYCSLVPSLVKLIASSNLSSDVANSSLKRITFGGEKMSIEDFQMAKENLHPIVLFYGYGMTETGPLISTKTYEDWDTRYASVGRPIDGVEIKIVDENRNTLDTGETGSVLVKGQNITSGYINVECQIVENGWLDTGDIGMVDNDGYIYIYGRKKNIIISGGKNIFPEEIEEVLLRMDMIQEARVYSEDDPFMGESVAAEIVSMDKEVDTQTIYQFCKNYLADYKLPQKIYIVDCIEKTSTNKIKRN